MHDFQSLSDAEMEIMRVIWAAEGPVTAGQLLDRFADRGWKAQTMSTFLARLVRKGVLTVRKRGKANLYAPAVTEQGYRQLEARHVVDALYDGSLTDFLAALFGGEPPLRAEELEALGRRFDREAGHD